MLDKGKDRAAKISDLRRRLELLEGKKPVPSPPRRGNFPESASLEGMPHGEVHQTPHGCCLVVEQKFSLSHQHGRCRLQETFRHNEGRFPLQGSGQLLGNLTPERAMFIDTETTGLAMGAGTYAFLIGLGALRGERFVVRQFFMRDFNEESAQLYLLSNALKDGDYLVSYNGKSYDIPLLENRFVMSRMGMDIGCIPHIDLLYTARRLWKHRLADCRLATVEREMLGVRRTDDIPGEQIPEVFFNYLRGRNRGEISRVFQHNLLDIISLAALFGAIRSMAAGPLAVEPKDGGELFALGGLWEDAGMEEEGRYCYEKALDLEMPWNHRLRTMARLSLIHKRRGRWAEALNLWERMKAENPEDIFPYQELAKYYEHRAGDFDRALRLVEEALEKVYSPGGQYWGAADNVAARLEHRRNRLKRRARMRGGQ